MPHSLVKTSAYIMSSVYDGFAGRSNGFDRWFRVLFFGFHNNAADMQFLLYEWGRDALVLSSFLIYCVQFGHFGYTLGSSASLGVQIWPPIWMATFGWFFIG